ncbi:hypothetical protein [Exercitatus varius]|uniref:Uncharacterized protein n=1 Tax=Exercitatus varius TaxID=67857 RepID=A0AAW6Q9Y1_9PAST|nr:hypothetical protein [Exercitatus varius]MDG2950236.1 hypothetical protein [Exercitatus varius]
MFDFLQTNGWRNISAFCVGTTHSTPKPFEELAEIIDQPKGDTLENLPRIVEIKRQLA